MNGIYRRIRQAGTRTLRTVTQVRAPGGRARVIVAAIAAIVLAVGLGIGWGLAGDPRLDSVTARAPSPDPAVPPGVVGSDVDADVDAIASPGPSGSGSPSGGGLGSSGAVPGGTGAGTGSGGSGSGSGGTAGNRPPVIEDPGLSSDGMTLTIAPTVTDPDGDQVEVEYSVLGEGFLPVDERPAYNFPVADVGYRHRAEVTIAATDTGGATTRATFTHQLEAVTTVVVRKVELRLELPQSCFANAGVKRVTGTLVLQGADTRNLDFSEELRPDKPNAILLSTRDSREVDVIGERPRQDVHFIGNLAGEGDAFSLLDIEPPVRPRRVFIDSTCQATVRLGIQITTR